MGLDPQDVRTREFPVGLRGYEMAQVRGFLDEVGDALEDVLDRTAPSPTTDELMDMVGTEIASVLRTAKTSAELLTRQAEASAATTRQEAESYREQAERELDEARREAARIVAEARAERDRLLADLDRREQAVAQAETSLREGVVRLRSWVGTTGTSLRGILQELPQVDPAAWSAPEAGGDAVVAGGSADLVVSDDGAELHLDPAS